MRLSEIKALIEAVDALCTEDVNLVIDDSRDGNTSLANAKIIPRRLSDGEVVLIVRYE